MISINFMRLRGSMPTLSSPPRFATFLPPTKVPSPPPLCISTEGKNHAGKYLGRVNQPKPKFGGNPITAELKF